MDINTQRRMLEIAGMSGTVLTEAMKKKTTVKEDAQQSLERKFGSIGTAVADIIDQYKAMSTEPDIADEMNPAEMSPEHMWGYVEDMIHDALAEIKDSEEYKQLCASLAGQTSQVKAEPDQGILDV